MRADLPPLANLLAFRSADPARVADARRRLLRTWPDVATVDGWLLATRPLPKSRPVSPEARARGLAFAEGAEQATNAPGGLERIASVVRGRRYEHLTAVPGDATFLHLGDHDVTAVRSAAGRVPLHWWADNDEVAVGTLLSEVARLRPDELQLDPLVAALWASGQAAFHEGRTPVAGVQAVHPGEVLHLGIEGAHTGQRWWDPWPEALPRPRRGDIAAKAERFGDAIRATVADELAATGGNLLSLSGGVDSSTLAFLAHRAGRPLAAVSLVPPAGHPVLGRELGFIDPIVERLGISPHWARELTGASRIAMLEGLPDVTMPVLHPVLCLLQELTRATDVSVLVGGEFCDELCGGGFALSDWVRTASLIDFSRRVVRRRRGGLRPWVRHHTLGLPPAGPYGPLPDIVLEDLRDGFDTWRAERNEQVAASTKVHARTIELLASLDGAVAQNWEVCSAYGARRVFPFLTREVIETVAVCRPSELITPTFKVLSRAAFRGQVPDRWLDRADSGSFGREAPAPFVLPSDLPVSLDRVLRHENAGAAAKSEAPLAGLMTHELVRFANSLMTHDERGTGSEPG